MTNEAFLSKFDVKSNSGDQYICICPAHDDHAPSLAISLTPSRRLIHCFAGCQTQEVLSNVGLKMADLFIDDNSNSWISYIEKKVSKEEGRDYQVVDRYDYQTWQGEYKFSRIRLESSAGEKQCRIMVFLPDGKFKTSVDSVYGKGTKLKDLDAMYGDVDKIKRAISDGENIYYCEGEKDVNTMTEHGYVAFTLGSANDWKTDFSENLKDANIVVLQDNDEAGLSLSKRIVHDLQGFASSIKVIVPVPNVLKADISDYFGKHNNDDFEKLLSESVDPEWMGNPLDTVEQETHEKWGGRNLPPIECWADVHKNIPSKALPLIQGILRQRQKLLISGASKASKSFLLIQLAIAIAEGWQWLGFQCQMGRVLYINLEIDGVSFVNRVSDVYYALGNIPQHRENLDIWNLRGLARPLSELVDDIISRIKGRNYEAVIFDPIYKIITGDENNASDMGKFCNLFDRICREVGCATIYCHHHSKGGQGYKRAIDRSSGSGVFGRDPDAILDIIELEKEGITEDDPRPLRLESSLREFKNIKPINLWFDHPIHKVDTSGELAKLCARGSSSSNLNKSGRKVGKENRIEKFKEVFDRLSANGTPIRIEEVLKGMASDGKEYKVGRRCVEDWIRNDELQGQFGAGKGLVWKLG